MNRIQIRGKLVQNAIFRAIKNISDVYRWWRRDFAMPAPGFIKKNRLKNLAIKDGIWIETGTFLGETTSFLSNHFTKVYSIEPDESLYKAAILTLGNKKNIELIHGLSECEMPKLLSKLTGKKINFWLDGHYSGGITHKGPFECPIMEELKSIGSKIQNIEALVIFIDDIRCFETNSRSGYPQLKNIIDWVELNKLEWHIEHDILILKSINFE